MGQEPMGEYLKTYVWTMKSRQTFVQVIKGSFDSPEEEIKYKQDINKIDITSINQRKLIYPV